MEKALLRNEIKQLLQGTALQDIAKRSLIACSNVIESDVFLRAETILCYAALQKEADPQYIINTAVRLGKRVAYPYCINEHDMCALVPCSKIGWETGAYGIKTPVPETAMQLKPGEIDVVIVPGLAFDKAGGRLGRGKGYYDRYLSLTNAYRIGLCMATQMIDTVPMDQYDVRMQAIASEEGFYVV